MFRWLFYIPFFIYNSRWECTVDGVSFILLVRKAFIKIALVLKIAEPIKSFAVSFLILHTRNFINLTQSIYIPTLTASLFIFLQMNNIIQLVVFYSGVFTAARNRSKIFIGFAQLGSILSSMIRVSIVAIWKYVCKYKSVAVGWLGAKPCPRAFDLSDG